MTIQPKILISLFLVGVMTWSLQEEDPFDKYERKMLAYKSDLEARRVKLVQELGIDEWYCARLRDGIEKDAERSLFYNADFVKAQYLNERNCPLDPRFPDQLAEYRERKEAESQKTLRLNKPSTQEILI